MTIEELWLAKQKRHNPKLVALIRNEMEAEIKAEARKESEAEINELLDAVDKRDKELSDIKELLRLANAESDKLYAKIDELQAEIDKSNEKPKKKAK